MRLLQIAFTNEKAAARERQRPEIVQLFRLVRIVACDRIVARLSPIDNRDIAIHRIENVKFADTVSPNRQVSLAVAAIIVLSQEIRAGNAPGYRANQLTGHT